jgi:L-aminopeptidase/D-esterase-like protein
MADPGLASLEHENLIETMALLSGSVDGAPIRRADGVIEATEEAILNAMVAAETMTDRDGVTAFALPHDRLLETMSRYGRGARPTPLT